MATIRWKLNVSYWGVITPTFFSSPLLHEQIGMLAWLDGYCQMEAEYKLFGYNYPHIQAHHDGGWIKLLGYNYPHTG